MEFSPERSLYLNGEVDTQTSMEIITGISKLHSAKPEAWITLFVSSSGGSVSDTFVLYDYVMKALKPNLQTVALGEVNSTAVMLFLMGEMRHISRLSVMRFHRFTFTLEVGTRITAKKASILRQDLERSEKCYIDVLTNRTNGRITKEKARALLNGEIVVPATMAVKLGLAHKIL